MSRWLHLLRTNAALRRLWLAAAVSLVGDWLGFVAISVLTIESESGPFALAGVLAAHQLPAALLAPLGGTIVDRVDRRKLLVLANVVQATLTGGAALAALGGLVFVVQALVFVRSAVVAFVLPAEQAAIRRVVPAADLAPANALLAATWSTAFVLGMAGGGFLALLGPPMAIALDGATFLVAGAIAAGLPTMVPEREVPARFSLPRELREAVAAARATPVLLTAVLAKLPMAVAWGGGWLALQLVAAEETPFGPTSISIGVLQAMRGLGTGIGPVFAARAISGGRDVRTVLPWTILGGLVSVALFAHATGAWALLSTVLLWGAGSGATWVLAATLVQTHAQDANIGRIAALDELGNVLAMNLGVVIAATSIVVADLPRDAACLAPPLLALPLWALVMLRFARHPAGPAAAAVRS